MRMPKKPVLAAALAASIVWLAGCLPGDGETGPSAEQKKLSEASADQAAGNLQTAIGGMQEPRYVFGKEDLAALKTAQADYAAAARLNPENPKAQLGLALANILVAAQDPRLADILNRTVEGKSPFDAKLAGDAPLLRSLVLAKVAEWSPRHVCVTGGEPLAQRNCLPLLSALCDAGYRVSLETSGAMPIGEVDARVIRIVDVKTPGSAEEKRNRYQDLALLRPEEQIKFVICDRTDYDWARAKLTELGLGNQCTVLFSPSADQLPARELADWILADRLPVRFQLQLHKVLWGNVPGK